MKSEDAKERIAFFMRRLYERGLTTTSGGNLSIKEGELVFITPSASDKGAMKAEDIGVVSLNGDIVGKPFKPSIETRMHLEVYKARPDIGAIVHAHPPLTTTFAATDLEIELNYLSESYAVLGAIAYASYRRMGTPELAEVVSASAAKANCVVMRNHGALTVGRNLLEAFDRLEVLEAAAKTNILLLGALKGHGCPIPAQELSAIDKMMGR